MEMQGEGDVEVAGIIELPKWRTPWVGQHGWPNRQRQVVDVAFLAAKMGKAKESL
jgi:hypothetical protein